MLEFIKSMPFIQAIVAAFFGILFLQSGLDKVFDFKGNLDWLKGHFGKSPLKGQVPMMLGTITLFEVSAGILSAVGAVVLLINKSSEIAYYGVLVASLSLLMLFFGQRIAKDYAGAAGLVPYFIMAVFGLILLSK